MMQKPFLKVFVLFVLMVFLHPQVLTTQEITDRGISTLQAMVLQASAWRPGPDGSGFPSSATPALFSQLNCRGLKYDAFRYALEGMQWLDNQGLVKKNELVCIIDYSLPSTEKRLFVIDIRQPSVLYRTLVAHGQNTGSNEALHFSNRMGSHQSSLGFFATGGTYTGQNGYSLWLEGLDTSFNEMARPRAIVMHGAPYVSQDYILQYGRIGRSWGCPALPADVSREIIDLLKEGAVVFGYYPDTAYFKSSRIIGAIERGGTS